MLGSIFETASCCSALFVWAAILFFGFFRRNCIFIATTTRPVHGAADAVRTGSTTPSTRRSHGTLNLCKSWLDSRLYCHTIRLFHRRLAASDSDANLYV